MLKERKYLLLFVFWVTAFTYLSLFPLPEFPDDPLIFDHIDKVVHFFIYFVMAILGFLALHEMFKDELGKKKSLRIIIIFSIAYGLLIELLQHLMPHERVAEIWDMVANILGALLGGWLIQKYSSLILPLK